MILTTQDGSHHTGCGSDQHQYGGSFHGDKCKGGWSCGSIPVMRLSIDHVLFCVDGLEEAGAELERRFNLASLPGGRHTGHGTANRIVPLGSSYLELVAVLDPEEALSSSFGNWVAARAAGGLEPHAICLRTDDLNAVCDRLGLAAVTMSRIKPDGSELRWRLAGLENMISRGTPFYIEWEIDPARHPAKSSAAVDVQVEATLRGDRELLESWTAGTEGISVEAGEPGVASVVLRLSHAVYRL